MGDSPAIIHNAREAWLMRRREFVTASDIAAIIGEHPTRVPGDVYMEKLGLAEDFSSIPLNWGQDLQDGVGRGYARATGRPVRMESLEVPELVIHKTIPWLAATLDGKTEGCDKTPAPAEGVGVLETKATSDLGGRWDEDDEGHVTPPTEFVLQVHGQAACSGYKWGSLTAFTSMFRLPPWQDIVFDEELFALIVPKLEQFHHYVKTKTLPSDPDFYSLDVVKKLYPGSNAGSLALNDDDAKLVARWEKMCADRLSAKRLEDDLAKEIRLILGEHAVGMLPDGTRLTLNTVEATWVERYQRSAYRKLHHSTAKKGKK